MNEYYAHPAKDRILYCASSGTRCGYSNALASSRGECSTASTTHERSYLCLVRLIFTECLARTPRPSSVFGASQEGAA